VLEEMVVVVMVSDGGGATYPTGASAHLELTSNRYPIYMLSVCARVFARVRWFHMRLDARVRLRV
jgi:hypothetical protein